MKKIKAFIIAGCVALCTTGVKAQSFGQGSMLVSAGYGFGNFTQSLFSAYSNEAGFKYSSFGPVFVKGEYGVSDHIGLGLNIAYMGASVSYNYDVPGLDQNLNSIVNTYEAKWAHTAYSVLARMNIHFANSEKLDPYFGVGVGYRSSSDVWSTTQANATTLTMPTLIPVGFETTLGLRYYPTEHLGVYVEAGGAKAIVQGGLTFKF